MHSYTHAYADTHADIHANIHMVAVYWLRSVNADILLRETMASVHPFDKGALIGFYLYVTCTIQ